MEKTNVMRLLDQKRINYTPYFYETETAISATDLANVINKPVEKIYKTLVTVSKSKRYYVFMLRADHELDLKKAAKCVNEKDIEMLKSKDLLALTGYIHGGCSPIGMKKPFPTFIDDSINETDTLICSAGRIGYQVELTLTDLNKIIKVTPYDLQVK